MKKIILTTFATFILSLSAFSQTGNHFSPQNKAAFGSLPLNDSFIVNIFFDKCVSGNCFNGRGKIIYTNGNIYEGDFVNGKKEGNGTFTVPTTGQVYVGQFANERYHGRGKMTFPDGESYEGDWVDDKKTGKGKTTYSNGDVYEGDFVDNTKEGQGTYKFKNGNYYTGEWKNNLKHGYGKEYFKATDKMLEGTWKDDVFVGEVKPTNR